MRIVREQEYGMASQIRLLAALKLSHSAGFHDQNIRGIELIASAFSRKGEPSV
jgi:hypothetical protein